MLLIQCLNCGFLELANFGVIDFPFCIYVMWLHAPHLYVMWLECSYERFTITNQLVITVVHILKTIRTAKPNAIKLQ